MQTLKNAHIPHLGHREDYFDLLSGLASSTPGNLDKRKLPAGLQKSYLLETAGCGGPAVTEIMQRSDLACESVEGDEKLYRIVDADNNGLALLECISDRYYALYTLLPSQASDKLIRSAVAKNPWLDHLWISSQSFRALWDHVKLVNSGRRYGKVTFEHESVFEVIESDGELEANYEDERRASRFTMVDRLDEIERQLGPLQNTYAPLASITHLRIPASGPGGHELYYDGKVTNRSNSFLDHRSALLNVVDMYGKLTAQVEESLWVSQQTELATGFELNTAVAELVFSEELSEDTFRRWMINMFNNRRNRFRISGFPRWLSDTKVQANALDQHLWQPLIMEFTTKRAVIILPRGTCGNTINRLVSNVQRFVDPKVKAFVGDVEYSSLIPEIGMANVG